MPAKAGIHARRWTPACAGASGLRRDLPLKVF
jgi:hypothetical protein